MIALLLAAAFAAEPDAVARGLHLEVGPSVAYADDRALPVGATGVVAWERLARRDHWLTGYRLGLGIAAVGGSGDVLDPNLVPVGLAELVVGRAGSGFYALGGLGAEILLILPMPTATLELGLRHEFDGGGALLLGPMVRASAFPSANPLVKVGGGLSLSITGGKRP